MIKVPSKTNNSFNSTMMASFLPVGLIVSKKNKQRKICLLLQCITNSHKSWKKHAKNTKMTSSDVPIECWSCLYMGCILCLTFKSAGNVNSYNLQYTALATLLRRLTLGPGLEIGPVRSSEMTNNLGRTSSFSMSLSYWMSAPAWQLLGRTSDIFGKD